MEIVHQYLLVGALIFAAVWIAAQQNLLGPYGLPGDNLHLLILFAVLFSVYLVFGTALYIRGGER